MEQKGDSRAPLRANFHTHTPRCHHAVGEERAYIEAAIAGGLQVLGFSDHTPMPFPGDYRSGFRMEVEEVQEYAATLRALQKEYRADLHILIGLECEYYPAYFPALLELLRPVQPDYLLLGQHALFNEIGAPMTGRPTADETLLRQYAAQVAEGLSTGAFLYLAHPDMFHFTGPDDVYQEVMGPLCQTCRDLGLPVEINLLGLMEGRHYPTERFWRLAAEYGLSGVVGWDAHRPDVLCNTALVEQGLRWAKQFGIPVVNDALAEKLFHKGAEKT